MCETVGSEVTRLHRLAVGDVSLGDLEVGGVRRLEGDELEGLRRAVAAAANGEARGQHGTETRRVKTAPDGWGARIAAEADANTTFEDGERTGERKRRTRRKLRRRTGRVFLVVPAA